MSDLESLASDYLGLFRQDSRIDG